MGRFPLRVVGGAVRQRFGVQLHVASNSTERANFRHNFTIHGKLQPTGIAGHQDQPRLAGNMITVAFSQDAGEQQFTAIGTHFNPAIDQRRDLNA